MGIFRKKPITPAALFERITTHPAVLELQKVAAVDVAAVLIGLADVESSFDVLAEGDKDAEGRTHAWGLFQINSRVHKSFDPSSMGDVNYQIGFAVAQVAWPIQRVVEGALPKIRARREAGRTITLEPDRDVPNWWNIGWQYGPGGLQRFLLESDDLTVAGFERYRASMLGKPVHGGYARRASRFRARHDRVVKEMPSSWKDALGASVEAAAQVALATSGSGAAAYVADKAKEQVPDLPELPDPTKPIKDFLETLKKAATFGLALVAVVVGLVVIVIAVEIYRARRFTRQVVEPRLGLR